VWGRGERLASYEAASALLVGVGRGDPQAYAKAIAASDAGSCVYQRIDRLLLPIFQCLVDQIQKLVTL